MKMTDEHYATLKARVTIFADKIPAHKKALENDSRVKDIDKRLLWDVFHAAKIFTIYTYQQFDYKDSHIETAMKKILEEVLK